jgi:PilZ domain
MNSKPRILNPESDDGADILPPGQVPREPRSRALLTATLSNHDNSQVSPCIVTSLSARGARIQISETVPLSGELRISIPQRNMTRTVRQVWRKRDWLGVAFLSQDEPAADPADAAKVRALEAEVAALKAEVRGLKYQLHRREE